MNSMASAIVPKSDQLNADDLLAGPRTITITGVTVKPGEQPVSVSFQGDNGKPWKPCKSMCRVMVALWGPDANEYTGRSLTLYNDPSVKWGGVAVGGIRISHASHIEDARTLALTITKGQRKPFVVRPLVVTSLASVLRMIADAKAPADLSAAGQEAGKLETDADKGKAREAYKARKAALDAQSKISVDKDPAPADTQPDPAPPADPAIDHWAAAATAGV